MTPHKRLTVLGNSDAEMKRPAGVASRPLIKVRWPHGGWIIWNWEIGQWDRIL